MLDALFGLFLQTNIERTVLENYEEALTRQAQVTGYELKRRPTLSFDREFDLSEERKFAGRFYCGRYHVNINPEKANTKTEGYSAFAPLPILLHEHGHAQFCEVAGDNHWIYWENNKEWGLYVSETWAEYSECMTTNSCDETARGLVIIGYPYLASEELQRMKPIYDSLGIHAIPILLNNPVELDDRIEHIEQLKEELITNAGTKEQQ